MIKKNQNEGSSKNSEKADNPIPSSKNQVKVTDSTYNPISNKASFCQRTIPCKQCNWSYSPKETGLNCLLCWKHTTGIKLKGVRT